MRAGREHLVTAGLLLSLGGCTPLHSQPSYSTVWQDAAGNRWYAPGDPACADLSPRQAERFGDATRDAFKPFAILSDLSPGDDQRSVTVFEFGETLDPILSFLIVRGIKVQRDEAGNIRLYDTPELRKALTKYLRILDQRVGVVASNIAHVNTVVDGEGETLPYQRKVVVVHEDGSSTIERDPSPFRLVWAPNDSLAIKEGRDQGYMQYPNVDVTHETILGLLAAREYEAVRAILEALYGGARCSCRSPTILAFRPSQPPVDGS